MIQRAAYACMQARENPVFREPCSQGFLGEGVTGGACPSLSSNMALCHVRQGRGHTAHTLHITLNSKAALPVAIPI